MRLISLTLPLAELLDAAFVSQGLLRLVVFLAESRLALACSF